MSDCPTPGPLQRAMLRFRASWNDEPYGRVAVECSASGFDAAYRTVDGLHQWDRGGRWDDVTCVTAFMRDCWIVDQIYLAIEYGEGGFVQLSEDADGWDALCAALPERLPGALTWDDWWPQVSFPAFDGTTTVVFEPARQSS